MILRYRPARMIWAAGITATAAVACGWFGLHVPVPHHGGRYSLMYGLLGHNGMTAFFLIATAILIYLALKLVLPIASGYVVAESNEVGVRLRTAGHPIALKWNEIHSIERKEIGTRHKVPIVVLHHEPKKAGILGSKRTSTLVPELLTVDEDVFENWLGQVQARIRQS
ncbi:hypothetical protein KFK14_15425 [Sphingobium phenoxybenzoativorans]|uniref:Uncharacterized protein n=1 Tax=Sphingobium phenoxybenzoativorans TaxID=1592790 RepID=A0A975K3Z7_9SPHN|nr:hypothetical protein [Sphingobium phenoxybenzoativorans]QUT04445.1 hypothetical protein KFK14_15425 [Sphingobium phenoxybenzoativorans]